MREMKPSTRQRFISLSYDFPSAENEARIICEESGVSADVARRLVNIAKKIRSLHELSLLESVSTRLLVSAGKLIARDVPPRLACITAIAEPMTDEPETLAAIRQVIELSI
jgi:nitric oxide reductase NorQ protein